MGRRNTYESSSSSSSDKEWEAILRERGSKMSEKDLCDNFQPDMRIQVESLMGTVLDLNVSSFETIADVKKKIHQMEGIPTIHQNLIFRSKDLKDSHRLIDASITDGSTLTLVPSMRGGPISSRRVSITYDNHVIFKDLKELFENTREEGASGSKVALILIREGEFLNLFRVVDNDDSPRSEKPISPPSKPVRRVPRKGICERYVEDADMSKKVANLRKNMKKLSFLRRSNAKARPAPQEAPDAGQAAKKDSLLYKFSTTYSNLLKSLDLKIYERKPEDNIEEEIALKDKHRSKPHNLCDSKTKSLYSVTRGANSSLKQSYTRMNRKFEQPHCEEKEEEKEEEEEEEEEEELIPSPSNAKNLAEEIAVFEENPCGESIPILNRFHLTRLVFSESNDSPRSSTESIALGENVQDLWEIPEPASDGTTCEVGLLNRRHSIEYGTLKNSDDSYLEVCSENLYRIPQFLSPRDHSLHDYYFTKSDRSPLYCRKKIDSSASSSTQADQLNAFAMLQDYSSIRRLRNDGKESERTVESSRLIDEDVDESRKSERRTELPPVMKKRSRCNKCNRKLNVTNIHSCRCGKIFCSQHRYSEVHQCDYDYKSEGRKMLQQQNPLVAAEKISKI